jgi:Ca-activated chloride channel family protein
VPALSLHHFTFGSPPWLLALLVAPLLVGFAVAVRRRRSRYTVAFTNLAALAHVRPPRTAVLRYLPIALLALSLGLVALALARPRIETQSTARGTTIVLLADVSGSMAATDVEPARIYAAVQAMHDLVDRLPAADKVGPPTRWA